MSQRSDLSLIKRHPVELLTTKETARLMRVHPHTLEVWRSTGRYPELPHVRIGRAVRYRLSDVMQFLANNTSSRVDWGLV
jgi:excisionase family DNA binding protein